MTLLVLTIIALISVIIIFILSFRIYYLNKKLKYVDKADMWHKLAITDSLTGAYNRNAYDMQISKMKRNTGKKSQGVILFDIDKFKQYNDTKGHLEGDVVLKKVSGILLEVFPEPKYKVFRIGGDEFSVVSENISENEIIRRLLALKKRLKNENGIVLSKGYSMINESFDEAFEYADQMLYADKYSRQ